MLSEVQWSYFTFTESVCLNELWNCAGPSGYSPVRSIKDSWCGWNHSTELADWYQIQHLISYRWDETGGIKVFRKRQTSVEQNHHEQGLSKVSISSILLWCRQPSSLHCTTLAYSNRELEAVGCQIAYNVAGLHCLLYNCHDFKRTLMCRMYQ